MNLQCVPAALSCGRVAAAAALLSLIVLISACSKGGSVNIVNTQSADPSTVDFPIFYVKRSIPAAPDDLRLMSTFTPTATSNGVDLYERATASPTAAEINITAPITKTAPAGMYYDIKDVDTSPDGSRVAFAMRGPLAPDPDPDTAMGWRIWEYIIACPQAQTSCTPAPGTLAPMISPANDTDPATVNDVSPHYLPDGRIVFSSTRQRQAQAVLLDQGDPQFIEQDEARTEPTFNLHVISADRTTITQISFNQSHDRDATVLESGQILFSRWDHTPGHDAMSLYTANPDGTCLQLYYGANSHLTGTDNSTIEFVHPHETQAGPIAAIIRPYTGTPATATTPALSIDFGGNLVLITGAHFAENTQPLTADLTLSDPCAVGGPPAAGSTAGPAQVAATQNDVVTIPGPSPGGRFSSVYPLWDGTNRLLVTWTQCRLQDSAGNLLPCTSANLAATNAAGAPLYTTGPPLYSVWIYDPGQNLFLPVTAPVEGVMVTDVAAAVPRNPLPSIILPASPTTRTPELIQDAVGIIDIKSVYDVDGVDTTPNGIAALADGKTPATQRPARFLRLVKAVSIPPTTLVNLAGAAFGVSNYMREILGYIPIQPDGSVRVQVPANVAFQVSVLDANARQIATQGTWLQVAPGEVLTCNGCHTPAASQTVAACTAATPPPCTTAVSHGRRGSFAPVYAGAAGGAPYPDSVSILATDTPPGPSVIPNPGETMAETLSRATCGVVGQVCTELPSFEVLYTDIWTNTSAGLTANPPINLSYLALTAPESIPTSASCEATWSAGCRVRINYPEHIQPIWDLTPRMVNGVDRTCTQGGCHNPKDSSGNTQTPAGNLDLSGTASNANAQELTSYLALLQAQQIAGPPAADGTATTVTVGPFLDAGNSNGLNSSKSLALFAPGSGDTIHAGALTPAELRLISEWVDIGAQNFNDPFDPAVPVN